MSGMHGSVEERFWRYVTPEPNSGCWLWTGAVGSFGYGMLTLRRGVTWVAHRVAYRLYVGPLLPGLVVRHRCDVPCCVNPDHLVQGTQQQNIQDCIDRGRSAHGRHHSIKTHCPSGHEYAGANLVVRPNGSRQCRACKIAAAASSKLKRKAS